PETLGWVQRGQLREIDARFGIVEHHSVNRINPHQRVELLLAFALARLTYLTDDGIALAQTAFAHHRHRYVHVILAGQIPGGADKGVVVQDVHDSRGRDQDIVLADHRLGVRAAPPSAIAVPAVPPPTGMIILTVIGPLPIVIAGLTGGFVLCIIFSVVVIWFSLIAGLRWFSTGIFLVSVLVLVDWKRV